MIHTLGMSVNNVIWHDARQILCIVTFFHVDGFYVDGMEIVNTKPFEVKVAVSIYGCCAAHTLTRLAREALFSLL